MNTGFDIELSGLDDVFSLLNSLDEETLSRALHHGLEEGLQKIAGAAKMLCPVNKLSGASASGLKNSIKTRINMGKGGNMVGEVYVGKQYGVFVEMGTGPKGEQSHAGVNPEWLSKVTYSPKGWVYPTDDGEFRHTLGQPARPFLYPAYRSEKHKVADEIRRAIRRYAKKGR